MVKDEEDEEEPEIQISSVMDIMRIFKDLFMKKEIQLLILFYVLAKANYAINESVGFLYLTDDVPFFNLLMNSWESRRKR